MKKKPIITSKDVERNIKIYNERIKQLKEEKNKKLTYERSENNEKE